MRRFSVVLVALATALSLVACEGIGPDSGPGWDNYDDYEEVEEHYENVVYLECNGDVLVDEYFDSRDECERYRDRNGPWSCYGAELDIWC